MAPLPLGPDDQYASVIGAVPEAQASVKSRKACVNCRRQKMKCRIDEGPSCRRCLRTGVSCVFVPRANAAAYTEGYTPGDASHRSERSSQLNESILRRLQRLEDHVGLTALGENSLHNETQSGTMLESPEPEDSSLRPLRPAIQVLKNTCSAGTTSPLWEEPLIKRLWLSMRGSDEVVVHAAEYFIVLCNAIAQLCMPSSRGLPTIWACFTSDTPTTSDSSSFSGVDAAVIRDWARQLDDWLVEFGARNEEADNQSKLTFRQYVLHRLLVLSIYLPARGSDLFSNTTPKEQHELLVSARAAVKLQVADSSIWSNFDLVMITWAALIVIQGVDGGVGEPDGRLQEAHEHNSNLHGALANRLETKLQGLSTPQMGDAMSFEPDGTFDTSWYIFDQSSLDAGFDMSFLDGPLQ
ncbi:uncharacterized protein VDAG_06160 [Verticillium dahliae VdLs.17]|uniref:Zn(2)-C6 fungal-type domain-containing protein n=1 Tax=Verticillium dahliae (strain VdLs.17 / ATCC MYA-4575 / FGSC 10137) TaxID=498257 RepID=G2X8L9_VERDV|nr:uncharacterized protein VDAG_06160 [Verticillium dahliae VdLs.17]EGY15306.1 hypothetical protein VDAG_06160 [Verticillium dahliae VdLs.17]